MRKRVWIPLTILACAAAALTIIYFYGKNYFTDHFAYQVYVNGTDVSKTEMDSVLSGIKSTYPETFTIKEKDGSEVTVSLEGLVTNDDIDRFIAAQKEAAPTWFYSLFNETRFTASDRMEFKQDEFVERVEEKLQEVKRTPAKDAELDIQKMEVIPEKEGYEINLTAAAEKALNAVNDNVYEISLDSEYLEPKVLRDDPSLLSVIDEYEKRIDREITVHLTGDLTSKIKRKSLEKWISYNGKEFVTDDDGVRQYVEKLASKYNTAYSEREFTTSYGTVIGVGQGADDSYAGWMLDEDATFDNVLEAVKEQNSEADAVWILEGYTLDKNANDIGGTYIEISVDDQHMWFYKDYELMLDTDVVTGTETNPDRRTPRGLFYLLEMASPYVMHGDYGQQPCEYFIKVTWDGVAIHDADWQPYFGGDIYLTAGSHGCINTPHEVVAVLWDYLYEMEDWQIPVIIY